jgi:hypothetical protein
MKRFARKGRFGYVLLGVVIAGLAGGGWALAAGGGGVLHGCAKKHGGALRLSGSCKKSERSVSWNVQGPRGLQGPRGGQGAQGVQGVQGPPGVQYAWSSFTYPGAAHPATDGHVAKFTFTAPSAGFALVSTSFQVRVNITPATDCHIESQLASSAAVLGVVSPGAGSAGFVDNWVNGNLPTENGAGTYLGLNMSTSKVFAVVAGSNTIYLNGQYNGYGAGQANCADALWGPITVSAVFANQNPTSTLTAP